MNLVYIILELIYCLHCGCVVFAVHSKHFKNNNNKNFNNNNNNKNFENNFWFNGMTDDYAEDRDNKHRIPEQDIWNNYQSYQPSIDETLAMASYDVSTERPPYYLSYDSGIKTKYQTMEDKLIQEQKDSQDHINDQFYRPNTRTNALDTIVLASKKLSPDRYQHQIESQIKEQEHNQNLRQRNRKVGPKGLGGTFGFMKGKHFYPCDKPPFLEPDTQTGNYLIPESIGYYQECHYFDEDPRRQFQRKVGKLGTNGFYGYFEEGRFIVCPPPKRLEPDPRDPELYYIPNDIDYEPKCQYYNNNVGKLYDIYSDYGTSFALVSAKTLDKYFPFILLPTYVLILILSCF